MKVGELIYICSECDNWIAHTAAEKVLSKIEPDHISCRCGNAKFYTAKIVHEPNEIEN